MPKSKTSASQFEMLVDFMERNGDLSKPTTGPDGRLTAIRRWGELKNLLNSDATGDTKNIEKWRKVWSDLKNNTKRKKARILHCTNGTGGGPASKAIMSDLEDRVINIIGPQAASGISDVLEIGLNQEIIGAGPSQTRSPSPPQARSPLPFETFEASHEDINPLPSPQTPTTRRSTPPRRRRLTPRRRRLDQQNETSPVQRRRPRHQTQSERAPQEFLRSDREWRTFFMSREEEVLRLRGIELEQQARWQELFASFIDVLKNINK